MNISIEWFEGRYPSFNVALSSKEGKEPFLVIRGCKIMQGNRGEFVSWPATKNDNTGKYWNHVWASDAFAESVLQKAKEAQPKAVQRRAASPVDDDVPF